MSEEALFRKTVVAVMPVVEQNEDLAQRFGAAKQLPETIEYADRQISTAPSSEKHNVNSQHIASLIQNARQQIEQALQSQDPEQIEPALDTCNDLIMQIAEPYKDQSRSVMFELLNMRAALFRSAGYYMEEVRDKLQSYQYFGDPISALRRWKPANQSTSDQRNSHFLSLLDDMDTKDEFLDPSNDFYSTSMEQQEAEGRGRFVVSTEDIKVGTELVREKGYCVVVEKNYLLLICNRCLKPTRDQPYPCPGCNKVVYCCPRCAVIGWKFHQYVCGFTDVKANVFVCIKSGVSINRIARIGLEKACQLYARYENKERFNVF